MAILPRGRLPIDPIPDFPLAPALGRAALVALLSPGATTPTARKQRPKAPKQAWLKSVFYIGLRTRVP